MVGGRPCSMTQDDVRARGDDVQGRAGMDREEGAEGGRHGDG